MTDKFMFFSSAALKPLLYKSMREKFSYSLLFSLLRMFYFLCLETLEGFRSYTWRSLSPLKENVKAEVGFVV